MSPVKKSRSSKDDTRHQLLLAGERLFAKYGIDAVSLRQVNVEAGQKNSSASHYHFGSKEGLIQAIFDYRMERVNTRRNEQLDVLEASGEASDIRKLVGAMVYPIVEEIFTEDGQSYIQCNAQATSHPSNFIGTLGNSEFATGLKRIVEHLKDELSDLPDVIVSQRFGLALDQIIHALADQINLMPRTATIDQNTASVFSSNLVDMIAGGIAAPMSDETRNELVAGRRKKA